MAEFNFPIHQGTTRRITLTTLDVDGAPYDFRSTTIRVRVAFTPVLDKLATVNGTGTLTSSDGITFGRVNPADKDGPLIDTTYNSGHVTVRFAPEDTVAKDEGDYKWEARVERGGDIHTLQKGKITISDSIF